MTARKRTDKDGLTEKQRAALPHFIAPKSIEAGCRAAKVSKSALYEWLRNDEAFKKELETLKAQTIDGALSCLKAGIGGAVEKLLILLKSKDEAIQLRTAQTILEYYFKTVTIEQVEARIAELEKAMNKK